MIKLILTFFVLLFFGDAFCQESTKVEYDPYVKRWRYEEPVPKAKAGFYYENTQADSRDEFKEDASYVYDSTVQDDAQEKNWVNYEYEEDR